MAFLLLFVGLLAVPAWARTTDDSPIDGSNVGFNRNTAGDITGADIDVAEFESCTVEDGATITIRDEDGTEGTIKDGGNAEIAYEDDIDDIIISPPPGDSTIVITPTTNGSTAQGFNDDNTTVVRSTGISCVEAEDENGDRDRDRGRDLRVTDSVCVQILEILAGDRLNDQDLVLVPATDGMPTTDGGPATDWVPTTDGGPATDGVPAQSVVFGDQTFSVEQIQNCLIDNSINEEFINEEFINEEFINEVFDDRRVRDGGRAGVDERVRDGGRFGVNERPIDNQRGEVLADTIPNRLLPNTGGGVTLVARLVASAILLSVVVALLAGYAAARRRP